MSVANVLFLHEVEFKYNLSLFIVIVTSPDMTDKVSITSPDITDKDSIRLCIAVCFYIDSYLPLYYRRSVLPPLILQTRSVLDFVLQNVFILIITSPDITDKVSIRLCIAVCFYIFS